jgi:hypothetical protein
MESTQDQLGPYFKTFYGRNLRILVISYSVCPGKPFQLSLMFWLGTYHRVEHLEYASLG